MFWEKFKLKIRIYYIRRRREFSKLSSYLKLFVKMHISNKIAFLARTCNVSEVRTYRNKFLCWKLRMSIVLKCTGERECKSFFCHIHSFSIPNIVLHRTIHMNMKAWMLIWYFSIIYARLDYNSLFTLHFATSHTALILVIHSSVPSSISSFFS